jgi:hypothetical protein
LSTGGGLETGLPPLGAVGKHAHDAKSENHHEYRGLYPAPGDNREDELIALARNSFSGILRGRKRHIAKGLARIEQYRAAHPTTTRF